MRTCHLTIDAISPKTPKYALMVTTELKTNCGPVSRRPEKYPCTTYRALEVSQSIVADFEI